MRYKPTNDSCPDCDKTKCGFPELARSMGIKWYCWQCDSYFAKGSDNKYRKIIDGVVPPQEGEGENPGDHLIKHAGQRILGKSGPPGKP